MLLWSHCLEHWYWCIILCWNIFTFVYLFAVLGTLLTICANDLASDVLWTYTALTYYPLFMQREHSNEEALPCGQADIPKCTGKPSSRYYDDRRTLRFLGEPILLPESNEALDGGSIGNGRQDNCNCPFPGSIDCVRFHVAEKKDELKRDLGPAFYKMGLDKTGEDAALTWTKGDERRFNTIIQDNLPTSKYNFWGKLRAAFRSKGSKGLASYYHNVFQVRRRAYQNHVALNADSDDDSIEPGFLYSRHGDVKGSSRSRSAASSRNGRSS